MHDRTRIALGVRDQRKVTRIARKSNRNARQIRMFQLSYSAVTRSGSGEKWNRGGRLAPESSIRDPKRLVRSVHSLIPFLVAVQFSSRHFTSDRFGSVQFSWV